MELIDGKKMIGNSVDRSWTGCAFLFLQSTCHQVDLLSAYKDPKRKFCIFKAIKLTLLDTAGGLDRHEILKLHDADPLLGVEIKFLDQCACRRFLESYCSGAVRQLFVQHASRVLPGSESFDVDTSLKAGAQNLDECLGDQELCLDYIHLIQPGRLCDDEVSQLECQLHNLALGNVSCPSPSASLGSRQESALVPSDCFLFQKKVFDDRQLTPLDHQRFASSVGRDWKKVGRALQKTCRALKGPAIENLAYEYEREGLYEQAYQLLSCFIQAEGKDARLGRLVRALEETKLVGLAEIMLGLQSVE